MNRSLLLLGALSTLACGSTEDAPEATVGGAGGESALGNTAGVSGAGGGDGTGPVVPATCDGRAMPPRADESDADLSGAPLEPYFPTTEWRTATPAEARIDEGKLEEALNFEVAGASTQAIIVLRHGHIVAERYFDGVTESTKHESYSMAKSFTSALVGIAIEQGLLSGTDELLCQFYEEWDCEDASDPRSRITIDHAMNLTTGLEWVEDWRTGMDAANDVYRGLSGLLDYTLAKPSVTEPGTEARYSTGDPSLLSGALQTVTGKTALAYAQEVLFGPLGMSDIAWGADSKGRTTTYAGLQATARQYAKFGYLYLRDGQWDGEQIVPADWVHHTTQPVDACAEMYRYLWHVNMPVRLGTEDPGCSGFLQCLPTTYEDLPVSGFFAEGIRGQFVFVLPSRDLVVVRLGVDGTGSENWDEQARGLLARILEAVEP